ncbi:integrase [Gordonia phage Bjanes7]|uniref:Integrase n=3 Tax=Attisvirus TaxID=2169652 RepID=A0A2H4PEZ9_9CAUD|nr:integrase [Gordonia phage Bjanes7]ATW60730.1 integrase [Gordonia phage Bjanes7]
MQVRDLICTAHIIGNHFRVPALVDWLHGSPSRRLQSAMKASISSRTLASGREVVRVRWREQGKQKIQTFHDAPSAEIFRRNVEKFGPARAYEIAGVIDSTPAAEETLAQAATHHIAHLTGVESGTIHKYERYVANDLAEIGQLPLLAITDIVVAGWVHYLQHERKNSGKTIANKHGFLFAVFERAKREGKVPANPCERTRLPRKDAASEPVFLTRSQFDEILGELPERYRPLVTWLVATGMRFGEATAIQVGDINPTAKTARIMRAWKYTGRAQTVLGPPKSKAGRRTINLAPQALAVVDLDRPATDLAFATTRGGQIRYPAFFESWSDAVKAVGIDCSPHDLRHTCASWMIAAGVPLPVIQAHLGHESITVTIGVYGHLDRSSHESAAAAIGQMLA